MDVKTLGRNLLYWVGVLGSAHALRNRRVLTTLMFHRVLPADGADYASAEREFTFSVEGFGRCLDFVKRHYNCVTLSQVHDALYRGGSLPPRPVLITFDDGWRDTLIHAQHALQERGMSGVLFVATESLSATHDLWWQYVLVHVLADPEASAKLCRALAMDSGRTGERANTLQITARVAALPDSERHRVLDTVAPSTLGGERGRQMLTLADLDALAPDCIELGAHGHTHAPLLHSGDVAGELHRSHDLIAPNCVGPVTMSFPHGSYDERLLTMSREAGFEMAFTSDPVLSDLKSKPQPWKLGRVHVPENQWTCNGSSVSFAKLATFLFFRPHA